MWRTNMWRIKETYSGEQICGEKICGEQTVEKKYRSLLEKRPTKDAYILQKRPIARERVETSERDFMIKKKKVNYCFLIYDYF